MQSMRATNCAKSPLLFGNPVFVLKYYIPKNTSEDAPSSRVAVNQVQQSAILNVIYDYYRREECCTIQFTVRQP